MLVRLSPSLPLSLCLSSQEKMAAENGRGNEGGPIELSISLDRDGRAMARGDVPSSGIEYGFRNYPSLVSEEDARELRRACVAEKGCAYKAARPVADEEGGAYSTGETFFIAANEMPPRGHGDDRAASTEAGCGEQAASSMELLERLACDIFRFHVPEAAVYDPSVSGAEFWVLALNDDDDDDDDEDGEDEDGEEEEEEEESVAMHWDKDYTLEEECELSLYPNLSTVTYLSAPPRGAPTCVVTGAIGPTCLPGDEDEPLVPAPVSAIYSLPEVGKHIVFDGRLLHGAPVGMPDETASGPPDKKKQRIEEGKGEPMDGAGDGLRVTFLVNIWLNHVPCGATRRRWTGQPGLGAAARSLLRDCTPDGGAPACRTPAHAKRAASAATTGSLEFAVGFGTSRTQTIELPFDANQIREDRCVAFTMGRAE